MVFLFVFFLMTENLWATKVIDWEEGVETDFSQKVEKIEELPVEILEIVAAFLPSNDQKNLRLVNKAFKGSVSAFYAHNFCALPNEERWMKWILAEHREQLKGIFVPSKKSVSGRVEGFCPLYADPPKTNDVEEESFFRQSMVPILSSLYVKEKVSQQINRMLSQGVFDFQQVFNYCEGQKVGLFFNRAVSSEYALERISTLNSSEKDIEGKTLDQETFIVTTLGQLKRAMNSQHFNADAKYSFFVDLNHDYEGFLSEGELKLTATDLPSNIHHLVLGGGTHQTLGRCFLGKLKISGDLHFLSFKHLKLIRGQFCQGADVGGNFIIENQPGLNSIPHSFVQSAKVRGDFNFSFQKPSPKFPRYFGLGLHVQGLVKLNVGQKHIRITGSFFEKLPAYLRSAYLEDIVIDF